MLRGPGVPPSLLRPLLCAGSQLLTDGIVTDCHEIAHALGVASFRQRLALVRGTASPTAALAVLQTTVAACGAVCLYGCVHGAIAAYVGAFVAKAAVEEDAALSAIFEYCHTTFTEGAHGRDLYACIHGIPIEHTHTSTSCSIEARSPCPPTMCVWVLHRHRSWLGAAA